MRVTEMNWMQVEAYLQHDDRCIVPLGSTEQHAYLSLSVDSILSEHVAAEAAEPLGVPVFPVVAYGLTPYFQAFPGTISLRMETYIHLVRDILDGLYRSGFRRILLCNGHGGNAPAGAFAIEWMADHPDARVRFHSWWNSPEDPGRRCSRRTSWRPTHPGWRIFPGRGSPTSVGPRRRSRWWIWTGCACSTPSA